MIKKVHFKRLPVLYFDRFLVVIILSLLTFSSFSLKALPEPGSKDSIASVSLSAFNVEMPFEEQINIIQTLNENGLYELAEHLLSLDSIPSELFVAINIAAANIKHKESCPFTLFPSSELYEGWCPDKLFSEYDKSEVFKDSSFTLVLQKETHNEYKHPFNGPITSTYGWRNKAMHRGIDIDLEKGDTVASAFDGIVRYATRGGGFGNVVIIRHHNGLETVYAHLSKILVKPDQYVSAGDIIGLGGNTGHSTGSHLHFEIRFKGATINPQAIISFSDKTLVADEFIINTSKKGIYVYTKDSKFYTVGRGDNINTIAQKFGIKTTSIRAMNNLYSKQVYLKPGQQICVSLY
jgi:murein DD-endopeptidase MepM/ murein hydrolase activator NlpD